MATQLKYIPALRFDLLTPVYDPALRRMMPEVALKQRLIAQAQIAAGQSVLDLGAGTGTLTVMIEQACQDADVVGLDGDPAVLTIARGKATAAGVAIRFDQGRATELPYDDGAFDRVLSSLLLHHLDSEDKQRSLREAWRVLRPGGELHVLDFGPPQSLLAVLISLVFRRLERTSDIIGGQLPGMLRQAGFSAVAQTAQCMTIIGTLALYPGPQLKHQERSLTMAKDPVCGMDVDPKTAAGKSEYQGQTYYFCSIGCKKAFDKEPARYAGKAGEQSGRSH